MKKITSLLLLMMFISSTVLLGQESFDNTISKKEAQMMNQRRTVSPNAQNQAIPTQKLNAKGSTTFTVPASGSRAISNINIALTVDSWYGEASYNLWSYDDGSYYWGTDQTFTAGYQTIVHVLALTEGSSYDLDCFDSYGDGGIGGVVTNDDTGWPITDWGAYSYSSYGAFPFVAGPGMQPVDITTFPYTADFEDGLIPPEFVVTTGAGSDLFVSPNAAHNSNFGLLFEGNTSTGYGSTPTTYAAAFDPSKASHFATVELTIVPDGSPGNLTMLYDFMMGYSFSTNYAWFRTLINGNPLYDVNGDYYWRPSSHSDPFETLEFDLSAYQNIGTITVTLQSSLKYYENYYQQGDVAFIDNFELFYLTIGDLEGYVLNSDGLTIAGADVWMEGVPPTTSNATGYYSLLQVPAEWQDINCYKDGYNLITDNVYITPAGTTQHDLILTQPSITINPLFFDVTLNPNEYYTTFLGLLNTGSGPGGWEAVINYTSKSANNNNIIEVTTGSTPVFTKSTGPDNSALLEEPAKPMEPTGATRDLFECTEGSLFGNSPVGNTNAYWSQNGGTYQQYQQVTGLSDQWTTVTFWGVFTSGTPTTADFFIGVYANGAQPGAEIASYIVTLDPVNTGEVLLGSYPIYQWIAVIDAQDATDFYISCQNIGSPQMYWLNSPSGTGSAFTGPSWSSHEPLAVCIEGSGSFGGWLSLSTYEGTVPGNGGTQNVGVNFDATGAEVGEVYTAEIVLTTDPNCGTFNIPVTMTIFGDPLTPVTDLEVELVNEVTGQVNLTWMFTSDITFQYFMIKRNGVPVGTTTNLYYTNILPDYGTYCYTVTPVFLEGNGVPAGPECVDWLIPALCWSPATMYNEQWPDTQEEVILTLENCGDGTLEFLFPDYVSGSRFACDMEISLHDSYGDGWNGGTLDVFVNGNVVLNDITLSSGSGPVYFSFPVEGGDDISTTFTPGGWPYECSYRFYDGDGNHIYTSPYNNLNLAPGTVFGTCPVPSYIIDVDPAMGTISSGSTVDVTLTYDATGFPVGLFDEWLNIETNDPLREQDSIFNQMLVYIPGQLFGTVTDCNSGLGMQNVTVTAVGLLGGEYTAETNGSGYYSMYVDEDTYDVYFELLGFESSFVGGVFAPTGVPTEVSTTMCETPYPVNWVFADPNEADTECMVTWTLPMGPYEIIYDDGEADDFVVWTVPGGGVGVHFTPAGYPATVLGGRLNVGDGSFPAGANFLGSTMAIGVMDDDGVNGLPGTLLDSVGVDVANYGWVDFYGVFNTTITSGDFYIVMWQLGWATNSAPCGVDTDLPTVYRSVAMMPGTGTWAMSVYQDFMIRAYVSGPNAGVMSSSSSSGDIVRLPKVTEGPFLATSKPSGIGGTVKDGEFRPVEVANATRDLSNYTVARVSNFDPDLGPTTGTLTPIANPTTESYNDAAFGGLAAGFYAYAVKAVYESNESIWVYSNTVAHGLDNEFTVNVSLCDGNDPDNAEVTLIGHDYPYDVWYGLTDIDGVVVFDSVIDGTYDLFVYKPGYTLYEHYGLTIYNDMTYSIVLTEKAYEPRNLFVEPLTSVATWDEPLITQLYLEGFEGSTFPPARWQATTLGIGWFRSDDGGTGGFPVPAGDGFYAISNDDATSTNDGSEDYLITPELDLRESTDFELFFTHYFTGAYGQSAYVEYSYDAGATWDLLQSMNPVGAWTEVAIDLAAFSGTNSPSIWIAFHADDNGDWASGWAVDNVQVRNGPSPIVGYYVFLNGAFAGQTAIDERTFTFMDLAYGETYTAAVRALYACGLSLPVEYTWQSTYLHPPRNIGDEYIYGTNEVPLMWNPPMTGTIPMAAAFNIVYVGPQLQAIGPNVDAASEVTIIEFEEGGSRVIGDLQFAFPTVDNSGEAGCESDGEYVYTVLWNGSNYFRYDLAGNLLETFTIPGTSAVRDLAYDGEFMYGAAANTTVYVMDFNTHTLVTSFTAPTAVRAIAYNEDTESFYGNNWGTAIVNFDASGANLGSFTPSVSSIYGLAYDKWTDDPNQYLWAYDQGANNLIQFALPGGAPTGLTINANAIAGATGIAGGAYTQPQLFASDKVTIGGNAQNNMMWGIELADYDGGGGGGGGMIPNGLVSFNLYRDGVNIANVPYAGQGVDEWVTYVDNNVDPGTYGYDVSAVYDLTIFGFPGDYGESAWNGTDIVDVVWGFDLPFFEGWNNGTFTFQGWSFNDQSANWKINSQVGDPAPSAEFTWDPLLVLDYTSTLVSNPITADLLTEGDIWMDFDLKLNDRNSTGEEKMLVEVYDGANWNQVAEFANTGSFDFTGSHIDITNYSMSRVFKVRFNAVGQNSFDIVSWFVDNISIYRECAAPTDLIGAYVWNDDPPMYEDFGVEICWEAPYVPEPISDWIHWDSGINDNGIGLTGGGTFSVAARWDAGQLSDYAGTSITKMQYFPQDGSFTSIILKIWTGANAGTMIYEEDVTSTSVVGMWNEVTLTAPIPLPVNDELWVGYTVTHTANGWPAGTDAGPAIVGYGDMITMDGSTWDPLSSFGLDYNWNVQFYVTEVSSSSPVPMIDDVVYDTPDGTLVRGGIINESPVAANGSDSRFITGFNIYRMEEGGTAYELYDVVEYVNGQSTYCYFDAYPNVDIQTGYYYQVTSAYSGETDACESSPAMAYELPMDDFVYVFVTDIANPNAIATTNVYPNPAQDMVTVTSSLPMTQLTVTNYVGQVVYTGQMNDATSMTLNTGSYQAGVYLVKINTENGVVTKRVIITR